MRGWRTTYFPDGPGLGASFDKKLLHDVGRVVGMEVVLEQLVTFACGTQYLLGLKRAKWRRRELSTTT